MKRPVSLSIIFGLGFGVSALLNVAQHSWAQQDKQVLRDELATVRSQAKALHNDTPDHSVKASPSPTEIPLGPGQERISVSLYEVKLIVTDPIKDLVYGSTRSGTAGFTTESLLAKYPDCKAGALGELVRSKAKVTPSPTKQPSASPYISRAFNKTVGGYTYTYRQPIFSCVTDRAGRDVVAAAVAALKNQALPTLAL